MILRQKTKREVISTYLNAKNFLIGLMVATFMVFASGVGSSSSAEEFISILIGAGLFSVAAALLIWARDISKNFYA